MTEFEKMGCTYRQEGDYFLPNLKIGEQDEVLIGVWVEKPLKCSIQRLRLFLMLLQPYSSIS